MESESKYYYLFPKMGHYVALPIGLSGRLAVCLTECAKRKEHGKKIKVPKYAAAILILLCELAQLKNLYGSKDNILPIEISSREIARFLRIANHTTVNNTLLWLYQYEWIDIEYGVNKTINTTVKLNRDKILKVLE